jgi:hypothetical protein
VAGEEDRARDSARAGRGERRGDREAPDLVTHATSRSRQRGERVAADFFFAGMRQQA